MWADLCRDVSIEREVDHCPRLLDTCSLLFFNHGGLNRLHGTASSYCLLFVGIRCYAEHWSLELCHSVGERELHRLDVVDIVPRGIAGDLRVSFADEVRGESVLKVGVVGARGVICGSVLQENGRRQIKLYFLFVTLCGVAGVCEHEVRVGQQ